jgi:hypothetical protein
MEPGGGEVSEAGGRRPVDGGPVGHDTPVLVVVGPVVAVIARHQQPLAIISKPLHYYYPFP